MTVIEALILGIIQGLTEFLPVSSSGHLFLGQVLLGIHSEEPLLFTIVVHFATALSTIVVFRKDILDIVGDLFKRKHNQGTRYSLYILLSMIPAVLVGLTLEDAIETITKPENQNLGLVVVGSCLLFTAALLYFSQRASEGNKLINAQHSFVIGIAQALATLPGISRSGATIATALLLGLTREQAARFSFLMVIPVIFGVMAKKGLDLLNDKSGFAEVDTMPLLIGFLAAFIAGWAACKWMIQIVKRAKLTYFAIYCLLVGLLAIGYTFV